MGDTLGICFLVPCLSKALADKTCVSCQSLTNCHLRAHFSRALFISTWRPEGVVRCVRGECESHVRCQAGLWRGMCTTPLSIAMCPGTSWNVFSFTLGRWRRNNVLLGTVQPARGHCTKPGEWRQHHPLQTHGSGK